MDIKHLGWIALWLVAGLTAPVAAGADPAATPDKVEFFESRIRPVLVEHCYECHNSHDVREGELAVDSAAAVRQGGQGGAILVPGQPAESRLLAILRHEVEDLKMPDGGPRLDDRVLADFEKWIADGAVDPRQAPPAADELEQMISWSATLARRKQWWSFQPIRDGHPPGQDNHPWSQHPIDRFVFEALQAQGLQPAPRADAETLVRRLYFALIGLPPKQDEIIHWTHRIGSSPGQFNRQAYEELVDQLLESPHFGERWARHWMDWIRYAESHGSEGDPAIHNAWMYRDYLIRALNADVPYDQLVREHVAGDLLPEPRYNDQLGINESAIGPAHWRMVFHGFAPTDALDEKVRFTDDQINAFSKAFLGLTVSCARCHDHKFDAISQRDYYAMFGILGSCRPARTVIDVPSAQNRNREQLETQKHAIRQALAADWLAAADGFAKRLLSSDALWKDAGDESFLLHPFYDVRKNATADNEVAAAWQKRVAGWKQLQEPASLETGSAPGETIGWRLGDSADFGDWFPKGLGLADSPHPPGTFAVAADGDVAVTGIYPAGVYSHALSSKHAARLTSSDIRLDQDLELWVRALGDGGAGLRYVVQNYPRNGTVYPVTNLKNVWDWHRFDLSYWSGDQIHIELASGPDAPLLVNDQPRSWFGVREARLVAKGQPRPADRREYLEPLVAAAGNGAVQSLEQLAACYETALTSCLHAWRDGNCTDAQAVFLSTSLAQGLLSNRLDDLPSTKPLIEVYRRLEHEIPVPTRVPGLDETIGRDQPLMERGNHLRLGEPVPRRFLEAIDPTPYNTPLSGRVQLADDLLRDENPLTRRVIVNRIWHHLFGRGIVATPDNFGRLGELPTHPELLDWLAAEFPRQDWSLKRLIRSIVTSQTWQLDSRSSERAREVDPLNRYLSHASVRRLEAEAIRDAILQVAGDLDLRPFGPPVGGNAFRRSVYVQVQRNALDPFLRAFDFPEPFSATGRRDATNVPAQSLTLMNDPQIASYANAWARRILANVDLATDEERIQAMFHAALSRPATQAELSAAQGYLAECHGRYQQLQSTLVDLQDQVKTQRDLVAQIMGPARRQLLTTAGSKPDLDIQPAGPIGRWEFEDDLKDSLGPLHGKQHAQARVENGNLVLDGGSYVTTEPLQQSVRAKTLEVWVQLGNLDQRGGGVMTIQSADGQVFDAIVFGEQQPRKWLAGSNVFQRTEPFQGPDEAEAHDRIVHFAIVYHADGRIAGYRDGQPYGQPYQSSGLQEFAAGQTVIGFGIRHLPAGGNRLLTGRIQLAQLYDRALSAEEIQASFNAAPFYVSDQRVLESLSESQRKTVQEATQAADDLQSRIESYGPVPDSIDKELLWTDLARAMFTLQEFIYIR